MALALAAWVAPSAAQAQAAAQLPPRVQLRSVLSDLILYGVHVQPDDFVTHYAAYLDAVGESWLQVEQQLASAPKPAADSAEQLVPSVKEVQRNHQALTAAALQGRQMLDAFLDKLAARVPPEEADAFRAFRDQCQISFANEVSAGVMSQVWLRPPQEIGEWLRSSCNPLQLKEEQRVAIAAALMLRSAERSQAAQDLTRTLMESAMAGAKKAEELGKQNAAVHWYEVEDATRLSKQAWARYAGLQWACWKDIRALLPASLRRYLAMTFLTTLVQQPELVENWEAEEQRRLPVSVDQGFWSGPGVVRTALAVPGLTAEQRKELIQIGQQWADAKAESVESIVQAGLTHPADIKQADGFEVEDEYLAKLAKVAAVPWLMGIRALSDPAVAASVPDRSALSLAPEDDAAFPLPTTLRSLDPAADALWDKMLSGMSESVPAGAKEQLLAALALDPSREAVVRLIWDDADADWRKNVAPRFQEYRSLKSKVDLYSRMDRSWRDREASSRRAEQATKASAALSASWAAADAWYDALAATLRASVPPEREGIVAAFVLGLVVDASMPVSPYRDMADVNPGRAALCTELSPAARAIAVQEVARAQPLLTSLVRAFRDRHWQLQPAGTQGDQAAKGRTEDPREAQSRYRKEAAAVCAAIKGQLGPEDATMWALLLASDRCPLVMVWLTDAADQLNRVAGALQDQQPSMQAARAVLKKEAAAIMVVNQAIAAMAARVPDWVSGEYTGRTPLLETLHTRMRTMRALAMDRRLLALIRVRTVLPPELAGQMSVLSKLSPVDALRRRASP
ncbi:MAG: hypothetical protein U0636_04895 [Phycisphaerales bacterium]